jgi:hypothetical protein
MSFAPGEANEAVDDILQQRDEALGYRAPETSGTPLLNPGQAGPNNSGQEQPWPGQAGLSKTEALLWIFSGSMCSHSIHHSIVVRYTLKNAALPKRMSRMLVVVWQTKCSPCNSQPPEPTTQWSLDFPSNPYSHPHLSMQE